MVKKNIQKGYKYARYVIYRETLIDRTEHFWSFIGAFFGIGIIAFLQSAYPESDKLFLIGSFGASSVLLFGAIQSPLAQPRHLIGGHVISALIGVSIQKIMPDILWLKVPLAVGLSIIGMQATRTLHPPGGATAMVAIIGSEKVKNLGYAFIITPVLCGTLVLLLTALIFNNMTSKRKYPTEGRFSRGIKWIIRQFRKAIPTIFTAETPHNRKT